MGKKKEKTYWAMFYKGGSVCHWDDDLDRGVAIAKHKKTFHPYMCADDIIVERVKIVRVKK
jgi:hypothetical protein